MRKPVLAPSGTLINNIIGAFMLRKEVITVDIQKIPTRLKRIDVDLSELHTWKEFIMAEVK